jgi:DNA-damage-inducible protein J
MSEQVLNQFRSDKALRDDCIAIYNAMGMDLNTAFRMFMERTRMVRGLPFPAVLPDNVAVGQQKAKNPFDVLRSQAADLPELSLDEINAEISAVRAAKEAHK